MNVKAAVLTGAGVEIRDVPRPTPKPTEVLVRTRACGLNRADLTMVAGHRHGSHGGPGAVAGMEFAGEVVEVGVEVADFKPGDRVMGAGHGAVAGYGVRGYG